MHANLCVHVLASTFQDGDNLFPVTRLPVLNSVTDSSRHSLLLPSFHRQWSRQVYIIHRRITGFLVVQEPTYAHTHEYRLLGASCSYENLNLPMKNAKGATQREFRRFLVRTFQKLRNENFADFWSELSRN